MKRNQITAVLLAILLFGSGFAAGALAHRFYRESVVSAKTTAEDARERYVNEMRSKLRLTPAQLDQLQVILDDTKTKAKAVRDRYRPEMVRIKEDQVARVKSILTPEQVPEYDKLVAERERRFHQQEERDRQAAAHAPSQPAPAR